MIGELPTVEYFKPRGIPLTRLEEVVLTIDEYEALKLADYEQLYQEDAAKKMRVSRQTFGRIILSAHYKLADALIHGKAFKIEGGEIAVKNCPKKRCSHCKRTTEPSDGKRPSEHCPHCKEITKKKTTRKKNNYENSVAFPQQ
jgi:predicted DNA-binding protein (UPF0251 family)